MKLLYILAVAGRGKGKGEYVKLLYGLAPPSPLHPYNEGREGNWKGWVLKLMYIKLTKYTTEYRTQKLMYINLPVYLFLYMALGLNDFDAGKSITWAIRSGGPL